MPKAADQYDTPAVKQLVALCHQLQLRAGDAPFFLSCRSVEGVLGMHYVTASRWLKQFGRDEVLTLVKESECRKANEYRFIEEV
jgi:hypothetical protein